MAKEESRSVNLILFTTIAPHRLTDGLLLAGFCVFEALSISEVFGLIEKFPNAMILIDQDVATERATVIQEHHITLQLGPGVALKDVIWELSHLTKTRMLVQ
jgi:hypothetical protein